MVFGASDPIAYDIMSLENRPAGLAMVRNQSLGHGDGSSIAGRQFSYQNFVERSTPSGGISRIPSAFAASSE